jgi:hypothetical protein
MLLVVLEYAGFRFGIKSDRDLDMMYNIVQKYDIGDRDDEE